MPGGLLTTSGRHAWAYLFAAWIIALAATFGALFIGEVMGQTPCSLCWHQRVFMFPLAVILAVATFREDPDVWRYALPIAGLGWLVAAFHSLLYAGIIPEAIKPCGQGPSCSSADMTVLDLPLPYLSLAAFTAIAVLLIPASRKKSNV
ncbi:disulfide bond formation protein B [Microvirga sp. SYSU G3D207]|uniref:Disulfide bond formation protein B n=2 Tax=Microvirga arsenatis TaxID=2692265 RepID=A0ABW9YV40_9HYPH|nr:disulfide bond formation protein B [Microvirga arsenatis]NBJ23672.1 disulfide bond formation protein B [Microvirga arsenatis]